MKTLSHPLLEVQLREPDTLAVSPLRDFATEILVSIYHVVPSCNFTVDVGWFHHLLDTHLALVYIMVTVRLVLCVCADHPECYRRAPPQPGVPASVEEETSCGLSGTGGALSQRVFSLPGSSSVRPSPGC